MLAAQKSETTANFYMKIVHRIFSWLKYQKNASSKYYLHSPFVYQFYLNVLECADNDTLLKIRHARQQLRQQNSSVHKIEFDTNRSTGSTTGYLERHVAVRHKYGKLLYALSNYYQPVTVIELGTSLGISTAYLAAGNPSAMIYSADGNLHTTAIAAQLHRNLKLQNIELNNGLFDELLPNLLEKIKNPCLIYIDGNHTYEATLRYFKTCLPYMSSVCIMVFDDIYWSKEMTAAWHQIKQHPQVKLTIDVYQLGICFFNNEKLAKEDFVLWY